VRDKRALAIEYYSASRDALSTRTVDPIRVVLVGDQSYLEGWCREAEGVRLFRFDRIVDVEVLDEASAPPVAEAPPNTALFDADPSLPAATLRVGPRAAWMLEYFPMRVLRELPGGSCEVAMTFAAEEWMTRLILGLGADVQVLTPESLVLSVRRAATAALAAYGGLDG
jgi:proteasome accessory factor C